jgi:hypothetical protein
MSLPSGLPAPQHLAFDPRPLAHLAARARAPAASAIANPNWTNKPQLNQKGRGGVDGRHNQAHPSPAGDEH